MGENTTVVASNVGLRGPNPAVPLGVRPPDMSGEEVMQGEVRKNQRWETQSSSE